MKKRLYIFSLLIFITSFMTILTASHPKLQEAVRTRLNLRCPDLVVSSLSVTPGKPTTQQTIEFTAVIKNRTIHTSKPCKATIRIGGESRPPQYDIPALGAGATHTIHRRRLLPVAITYRIEVTADSNNANKECSESNNKLVKDITVIQACPDLVVQRITHSPSEPTTRDTITFAVTIKNQGNTLSPACKTVIRIGGESRPPEHDIPALRPGAVHVVRRSRLLPIAMTYRIEPTVDSEDRVDECSEENNSKYKDITVIRACPDLVIKNIAISPTNPTIRDTIEFAVTIKNQGNTLSPACKAVIRIGGESRPPEHDIPALRPGAVHVVRRSRLLPIAMTYRIAPTADSGERVSECNETNNSSYTDITVRR